MKYKILVTALAALALLPSCGGAGAAGSSSEGKKIPLRYAANLSMTEHDGMTDVTIRNPWDTTATLQRYRLVDLENAGAEDGKTSAERLAEAKASAAPGVTVIGVPLDRSVVYSGVHASLIYELGRGEAVSGICDTEYIADSLIRARTVSGLIADCGNSMAPNVEKILSIAPKAVLLSPYENTTDHGKLDATGIAIVECADYMESSPLGRAEWMKFYGRLFGETAKADSLFNETEREYLRLRSQAQATSTRPGAIFDRIYGNAWYVPEKYSTTGRFIEDAGGRNPFDGRTGAGSGAVSPEEMLVRGGDADYWFIRAAGETPTLASMKSDNPLYARFKAFREGRIYVSDTMRSRVFEDAAFHPHWILQEYISIIHPETGIKSRGYYKKI